MLRFSGCFTKNATSCKSQFLSLFVLNDHAHQLLVSPNRIRLFILNQYWLNYLTEVFQCLIEVRPFLLEKC